MRQILQGEQFFLWSHNISHLYCHATTPPPYILDLQHSHLIHRTNIAESQGRYTGLQGTDSQFSEISSVIKDPAATHEHLHAVPQRID